MPMSVTLLQEICNPFKFVNSEKKKKANCRASMTEEFIDQI